MTIYTLPRDQAALHTRLAPRKKLFGGALLTQVQGIFDDIARRGDIAVHEATASFDKTPLTSTRVPSDWIDRSIGDLSPRLRGAIDIARANIAEVNRALLPEPRWELEIRPGTTVGEIWTPLESVGLYVPCRKGPLVSTALMLVTAAAVAGVKRIVVAMPPGSDSLPDRATIAAAQMAGATDFLIGNGVALIAAMAQGTESIDPCDGIFGPGPGGIAAAMILAQSCGKRTAIGLGPTDCMIIADQSADAELLVVDLLSEAEHGPDSSSVLVTTSRSLAEKVEKGIEEEIARAPAPRRGYLQEVFGEQGRGAVVVAPDLNRAVDLANTFAPEHLQVVCEPAGEEWVTRHVTCAGELLLGAFTPFAAANYAIGVTAVLPTNGFARSFSGVTSRDMMRSLATARLDRAAAQKLVPTIEALADHEGLPCHARSAAARHGRSAS